MAAGAADHHRRGARAVAICRARQPGSSDDAGWFSGALFAVHADGQLSWIAPVALLDAMVMASGILRQFFRYALRRGRRHSGGDLCQRPWRDPRRIQGDGGRVVVELLPYNLAQKYSQIEPYGFYILLGLMFTGIINVFVGLPIVLLRGLMMGIAGF